jgi:hypothetical protein
MAETRSRRPIVVTVSIAVLVLLASSTLPLVGLSYVNGNFDAGVGGVSYESNATYFGTAIFVFLILGIIAVIYAIARFRSPWIRSSSWLHLALIAIAATGLALVMGDLLFLGTGVRVGWNCWDYPPEHESTSYCEPVASIGQGFWIVFGLGMLVTAVFVGLFVRWRARHGVVA